MLFKTFLLQLSNCTLHYRKVFKGGKKYIIHSEGSEKRELLEKNRVALALKFGWKMNKKISTDFAHIRSVVEEHLSAINENSSEIQSLFDYLQDLEVKVEKVTARLDQIQLEKQVVPIKEIVPLNAIEKQIFLSLYMEELALTYQDIASRVHLSVALVQDSITSLVRKGIPLVRSFFNNQQFVQLETQFKERQAKENLINLSLESFF